MSKRREAIQQKMKMLQWQKMQTEANIRQTLVQARSGQEADIISALSRDRKAEATAWRKEIVDEELTRPLAQVSSWVTASSRSSSVRLAKKEEDRSGGANDMEKSMSRHMRSIQRLKKKATDAERKRTRHHEYTRKREDLHNRPEAGDTLDDAAAASSSLSPVPSPAPSCASNDGDTGTGTAGASDAHRSKVEQLEQIESMLRSAHR